MQIFKQKKTGTDFQVRHVKLRGVYDVFVGQDCHDLFFFFSWRWGHERFFLVRFLCVNSQNFELFEECYVDDKM